MRRRLLANKIEEDMTNLILRTSSGTMIARGVHGSSNTTQSITSEYANATVEGFSGFSTPEDFLHKYRLLQVEATYSDAYTETEKKDYTVSSEVSSHSSYVVNTATYYSCIHIYDTTKNKSLLYSGPVIFKGVVGNSVTNGYGVFFCPNGDVYTAVKASGYNTNSYSTGSADYNYASAGVQVWSGKKIN